MGNIFISSVSSLSFLFLSSLSLSFISSTLLSLFSLSLGDDTKWPKRVDVSLNPNTIKSVKLWWNLQSQTRSLQYLCTYQVWWKSFDVYSSYHPETKNGWMDVRQTDGHMDIQRETIIPRHYCVAEYKNVNSSWNFDIYWQIALHAQLSLSRKNLQLLVIWDLIAGQISCSAELCMKTVL